MVKENLPEQRPMFDADRLPVKLLTLCLGIVCISHWQGVDRLQAQEHRRLAFLVGVSRYHKDGLPDLKYGAKDAEDLSRVLKEFGFKVTCLTGDEASREAIETRFNEFMQIARKDLNKNDLVLVFLAGHGVQKLVPTGDRGIVEVPFFCACDSLIGVPETLVSVNWIMDELKGSGCSNNLLLVDACRDNPDRGTRSLDGSTVRELPTKLSVLFSSSPGQKSYESDEDTVQQGVFTHLLLEGLRGQAANSSGEVKWGRLSTYVLEEVPLEVARLTRREGLEQNPNLVGNLVSSVVLARVAPSTPQSRIAAPNSEDTRRAGGSKAKQPAWGQPVGKAPEMLRWKFDDRQLELALKAWTTHLQVNSLHRSETGGFSLRLIPAGEFLMGAGEKEAMAVRKWESPMKEDFYNHFILDAHQRQVRLTRPYFLGMHELTRGQFRRFVQEEGYTTEVERGLSQGSGLKDNNFVTAREFNWRYVGFEQDDSHPVMNVSWNDAVEYCRWLTTEARDRGEIPDNWEYRLPTEAEWEYACRSGSEGWYSFGDDPNQLYRYGNVPDAAYKAGGWWIKGRAINTSDGKLFTGEVGRYTPNRFGLFDMHGNLYEWCSDWYGSYLSFNRSGLPFNLKWTDDPAGVDSGDYRVFRGGSWFDMPINARSAFRGRMVPTEAGNVTIRIALSEVRQK